MSRWQTEVVELHDAFERWFAGRERADDAGFARIEGALASGFSMVTPSGAILEREPLLTRLRSMHGSCPTMKIWVDRVEAIAASSPLAIVRYEEWQSEGDRPRGRRSTAVLRAANEVIEWVSVHETWMPDEPASPR
ncbi:MAG: DUF4440 domain-containing protein [Phycisphaerales bacterium]|nr:DUF4440 domain-containing protein [Phycisphaerae bacterium]NNF41964.1 DUF4440 domain-containing protein [Phycisphaerales bacterium]NNM26777.1 DUF4440 domain-containing protein [Phycisphaerales bacterium]